MVTLIGKKIGMTRIFDVNGLVMPVTVIKIEDNIITCIKKKDIHGYNAVQITTGVKKKNINKAEFGFFNKLNFNVGLGLWEIPYIKNIHFKILQCLNIDLLKNCNKVNITSFTKGKGFSGTIKRWNFKSQDKSHGNSLSHRVPGSIGQNQTPGKVFKGKKMPGRMGGVRVTMKNLSVVEINNKDNFILIKGCIAGPNNNFVKISSFN